MDAHKLALWLRWNTPPRPDALTHLKLQKLLFYCYGAALAFDAEPEVGDVDFEAWKHGPVCRDVWQENQAWRAAPIPPPEGTRPTYGARVEQILRDVVTIYGALDAWSIRQESHLEQPWIDAWNAGGGRIEREVIRDHFRRKFQDGAVALPEYLLQSSSFALDGVPVPRFPSLRALATALERRATS